MQGRDKFAQAEVEQIRELLRQKLSASREEQKRIRSRLRRVFGFYISDWGGDGFGPADLERLVSQGRIRAAKGSPSAGGPGEATRASVDADDDQDYVIDLCDLVLGQRAAREHRFDFLRGDPGERGIGVMLPVDAYYVSLQLVVEYRERQHTEAVDFFDKPDKLTVSGVHRGEQRARYDQRRRDVLPGHGIDLVELSYTDFAHDSRKRLLRHVAADAEVVRCRLEQWLPGGSSSPVG